MNNSDFQRLLLSDDKALISELTKGKRKKHRDGADERKKRFKAAGRGGEDGEGPRRRKGPHGGAGAAGPSQDQQYRDRAKDRRELKGEYEQIKAEWENHSEVSVDQSKYLGGDHEHTHLVKGLDFALLSKVRGELNKQARAEELQLQRKQAKEQKQKKRTFQSLMAKQVWHVAVDTLHPHHNTFNQRLENMRKAISLGQRIRGATGSFLPGRMSYEFDVSIGRGRTDIPRIIYTSKEDAPKVDASKTVASALQETVAKVRESLHRAAEERKRRKHEKMNAPQASYTLAQKIVPAAKHKAADAENDIFSGAGGFNVEESEAMLALKVQGKQAKASRPGTPSSSRARSSYFDDAGAEKYRRGKTSGQLDVADVTLEDAGDEEEDLPAAGDGAAKRDARDPAAAKAAAAAAASGSTRHSRMRSSRAAAQPQDEDDAYGECFPDSGLGNAMMMTGEAGSDGEEDTKKKPKGKEAPDALKSSNFGKKGKESQMEARKKKMTENQELQKINHIIKNKKHGSIDELEALASRQRRSDAPRPRELTSTPAYF